MLVLSGKEISRTSLWKGLPKQVLVKPFDPVLGLMYMSVCAALNL